MRSKIGNDLVHYASKAHVIILDQGYPYYWNAHCTFMYLKKKPNLHTQKEEISIKPPQKEESNQALPTITIKWSRCFCNLKRCFALVLFFFFPEIKLVTVEFKTNTSIRSSAILILCQTFYKLKQGTVFSFATNVIPNIKDSGLMQHMMLSLPL